ncbi:MAG: methyltransferase [Alphaproteobacteria bacterium]|jgi:tRNA1(Val) A37 N6-methylase TrmN6|nr:methyltransferase [Alphaproteobacteria bacterium]
MGTDMADEVTQDGLLDRRILLRQPRHGYRAGSDAILLAAAVATRAGQTVLDAGAGVGAVSLCLALRCPDLRIRGLEIQPELVRLGSDNIAANEMSARVGMMAGDIRRPPPEIGQTIFDHTVCNPPFYAPGKGVPPPDQGKALAHGEGETPLQDWLAFCLRRTASGGSITVIHRNERLAALLSGLEQGAGDMVIFPLWAGPGRPAKRVIVQARVQGKGPTILHPGLCLHQANGDDTEGARAVLRQGAALDLSRAHSNYTGSFDGVHKPFG